RFRYDRIGASPTNLDFMSKWATRLGDAGLGGRPVAQGCRACAWRSLNASPEGGMMSGCCTSLPFRMSAIPPLLDGLCCKSRQFRSVELEFETIESGCTRF